VSGWTTPTWNFPEKKIAALLALRAAEEKGDLRPDEELLKYYRSCNLDSFNYLQARSVLLHIKKSTFSEIALLFSLCVCFLCKEPFAFRYRVFRKLRQLLLYFLCWQQNHIGNGIFDLG